METESFEEVKKSKSGFSNHLARPDGEAGESGTRILESFWARRLAFPSRERKIAVVKSFINRELLR